MATAGVKFASEAEGAFATNCFPARYKFGQTSSDASGAWTVAYHAEQKRRFKAVLQTQYRTYSRLKEERKKSEKDKTQLVSHTVELENTVDNDVKILDKLFLMKHCCVNDPTDLCSVNISGKDLTDVKKEDLLLFENVAYVNAGENLLPFEALCNFSSLRELEIPLNGLRNLNVSHTDFINLEVLDLSYNNLSQDDLLTLGLLARLKVLHLTGNNFINLPEQLAMPYLSREKQVRLQRFACLEMLMLDDNKLMDPAVFAALAGLPKLRHLDLSKNEIFCVPQLKVVEGRVVTQDGTGWRKTKRPGSSRKGNRSSRSHCLGEHQDIDGQMKRERGEGSSVATVSEVRTEAVDEEGKIEQNSLKKEELLAEDFSTNDLSARIKDFVQENDQVQFPSQTTFDHHKLPPFPELRYLNLTANKIYEEDGLLALAAWPFLEEVDIFNNPLTTDNSGDPPLLKMFLHQRLGIKLNRVKPQDPAGHSKKTSAEIRPKLMKITEIVPKIPKISVEEKMMLSLLSPPELRALEFGSPHLPGETQKDCSTSSKKSVLPPIPTSPKGEATPAWAEIGATIEDENENSNDFVEESRDNNDHSGPFFMTQPNEPDHEKPDNEKHSDTTEMNIPFMDTEAPTNIKPKPENGNKVVREIDERYAGYELLLDIEDLENEPELPPAKDIQANVRALKYALDHLLVFRDPAVEIREVKKIVPEYRRVPVPPAKPPQTYQQKVDEVLTKLKTRSTLEEENLATVLKNKNKFQKQFPEAEKLLGRIQNRYNSIQNNLLMDAKRAGEIAADVLELLPPAQAK